MSIEELKEILQFLETVSGEAKGVFFVWLGVTHVADVLGKALLFIFGLYVVKRITEV